MPSKHIITKKDFPKLEQMVRSKTTVVLFHAKWCIHCKMFAPEWSKFVNSMKNIQTISLESEVIQELMKENQSLLSYLSKTRDQPDIYFPKILVFVKGSSTVRKYVYAGERTADKLQEFVMSKLPKN